MAEDGGRVPMSPGLQATLLRAREYAASQSQAQVVLEHLLLALSEDADAAQVLDACRVDLARLRHDVAGYIGGMTDRVAPGTPGAPAISPQLTQVLKYATLAAQQGRRPSIDGAIVLAALIGDGRSMAASFLKAQGLTFEAAINALKEAAARVTTRSEHPGALPPTSHAAAAAASVASGPAAPLSPQASVETVAATTARAEDILARARERVESRSTQRGEPVPAPQLTEPAQQPAHPQPSPAASPDPRFPEPAPSAIGAAQALEAATRQPIGEPVAAAPDPAAASLPPSLPALPSERPQAPPPTGPQPPLMPDRRAPAEAAAQPWPRPPAAPRPEALRPASPPAPPISRPQPRALPAGASTAPPPPWTQPPAPAAGWNGRPPEPTHAQPAMAPPARTSWSEAPPVSGLRPPPEATSPAPHLNGAGAAGSQAGPGSALALARRPAVDPSQISHSIPPRLRQGRAQTVEVRIERPPLSEGTSASRPYSLRSEAVVARAIAVRLRPGSGRFIVEASSPETQWDQGAGPAGGRLQGEGAVWRFQVTPLTPGRGELQLSVGARTLCADGVIAETQLPDQAVEVRIGRAYSAIVRRIALLAGGAVLGMVLIKLVEGLARVDLYFLVKQLLRL